MEDKDKAETTNNYNNCNFFSGNMDHPVFNMPAVNHNNVQQNEKNNANIETAESHVGCPCSDFSGFIIAKSKENALAKLHALADGKTCKQVVMILKAAIKTGMITPPTARAVKNEFGIGSISAINKDMKFIFHDNELEPIINQIRNDALTESD